VCPYSFDNALPPIPADPKLIDIDFEKAAFVRFRYDSAIEAQAKYELLPEPDLGITIDLVDPAAYEKPEGAEIDRADGELLSLSVFNQAIGEKRSVQAGAKEMRQEVTWLLKTPILGNNLYDAVHKHQKVNMENQHVVKPSRELAARPQEALTLAQKIEQIEQEFDDAERGLVHPTDPSLKPEAVMAVLPDIEGWQNNYVQVTFDIDPSLANAGEKEVAWARSRVERALIKPYTSANASGTPESYFAYMLPPDPDDEEAQAAAEEGKPAELEWVREYQYEIKKQKKDEGQSYYLAIDGSTATYNPINNRIAMGRKKFRHKSTRPSSITLARRTLDDEEKAEHTNRKLLLQPKGMLAITDQSAGSGSGSRSARRGSTAQAEEAEVGDVEAREGGGTGEMEEEAEEEPQPLLQDADPAAAVDDEVAGGEGDEGMMVDDDDEQ